MRRMSLGMMGSALASLAGMNVVLPTMPAVQTQSLPKPKRKKKRSIAAAKKVNGRNGYSRSYYTPGGEDRNCGFNGISPKSYARAQNA